jgi:5-oxoprolinase (ATP-hydrolysing) subunit A
MGRGIRAGHDGSDRGIRRVLIRVDLNADIGESPADDDAGNDALLVKHVTSASIACGFHAGDPSEMRRTVRLAAKAGFGRHDVEATPEEIGDLVLYQIGAMAAIARAEGLRLQHVKPHGALYNMGARRRDVADAIAGAVASFDDTCWLVGLAQSELLAAGTRFGLRVAAEGFADRAYEPDGSLTPRGVAGALVVDPVRAAERAVRMVQDKTVMARDGSSLSLTIDTICVHGDTKEAVDIASAVRRSLEASGVTVKRLEQ